MALESYRTENSKLDEQLYKLKTAKSEMTKLFYELDRMIDSDEDENSHYPGRNPQIYDFGHDEYMIKRDSFMFYSSDDEKCYNNHQSEINLCENSDNEYFSIEKSIVKPLPYKPARISYSCRSIDTNQKLNDYNYYDLDLEHLIKSAENIQNLNFDELLQYNYIAENIHKSRDKHYKKYESSRITNNTTERRSFTSMPKPMPKPKINTTLPRSKWIPNGKVKHANPSLYRSSSSFNTKNPMNRSTSSFNKSCDKSSTSKLNWKPLGNVRPKSAIFYRSMSDLKKAEDLPQPVKKVPAQDPKDVGNGWRPTLKIDRNEKIYFTYEDVVPPVDEKVTAKKIEDIKDVGNGWKPAYKQKLENFFKTDPGYIRNTVSSQSTHKLENTAKTLDPKSKTLDSKDLGNGWKPTYKVKKKNIKFQMFAKPPVPAPSLANKKESDIKKEPSKKWAPTSKLKAVHPNTWVPEAKPETKAPVNSRQSKLAKYKQRINMLTSTPNMSMDVENKPNEEPVNESIIRNEEEIIDRQSRSSKNGSFQRGSINQGSIIRNEEEIIDRQSRSSKNGSFQRVSINQDVEQKNSRLLEKSLPASLTRQTRKSVSSSENVSIAKGSTNGSNLAMSKNGNLETSKQSLPENRSAQNVKVNEVEDLNEKISDSVLEKSEDILKEQSVANENSVQATEGPKENEEEEEPEKEEEIEDLENVEEDLKNEEPEKEPSEIPTDKIVDDKKTNVVEKTESNQIADKQPRDRKPSDEKPKVASLTDFFSKLTTDAKVKNETSESPKKSEPEQGNDGDDDDDDDNQMWNRNDDSDDE